MVCEYIHTSYIIHHTSASLYFLPFPCIGYCESFHNGLDKSERMVEMRLAKQDLNEYLRSVNRTAPRIGKGNDLPIADEHMQLITAIVENS